MPRLTKRSVDAFQAAGKDAFLWDSEVMGFGVRVKVSGAKAFVLSYRVADRPRRLTISKVGSPYTVEEARERARTLLRDLAAGVDPGVAKAERREEPTVAQLVDAYLIEGPALKPNKKAASWATDRSVIDCHIKPLIGRRLAGSLTGPEIAQFQADVANGKTARDVRLGPRRRSRVKGGRRVAALSTAILAATLNFGVKTGRIRNNVASGIELFATRRKERFLSDVEVTALADSLSRLEQTREISTTMADAVRLLLLTGCRKTEVLSLEWDWVDFQKSYLRLPDSKTGARAIPIAPAALELLQRRWTKRPPDAAAEANSNASSYVFPAARGSGWCVGLPRAWSRIKAASNVIARQRSNDDPRYRGVNLNQVRLHDLRHSFASFAIADGASLFMVGKILGHRQTRTTEIYAHLRDDPLRTLTDQTGTRIAAAMRRSTIAS